MGFSVHDELSYLREFEHLTLTRVFISEYIRDRIDSTIQDAIKLLDRLLHAAEDVGRMGSMIEIAVLQSFAHKLRVALHRRWLHWNMPSDWLSLKGTSVSFLMKGCRWLNYYPKHLIMG